MAVSFLDSETSMDKIIDTPCVLDNKGLGFRANIVEKYVLAPPRVRDQIIERGFNVSVIRWSSAASISPRSYHEVITVAEKIENTVQPGSVNTTPKMPREYSENIFEKWLRVKSWMN